MDYFKSSKKLTFNFSSYLALKNMKHNFKNLKIWILAMEITNDIYKLTSSFPKSETYSLVSQMNRCSVSMPSNIAEGSNRGNKHFQHYLNISLGSSFELQTQLLIACQNDYVTKEKTEKLENKIIEFQRMTSGFISKLD
ncbi:four helix bundle protein [Flavobacterium limi]|uniref:Four helix bundle protein n=2 Tax=Flavobacterium limi TaxID=2045105 RepID=A0ABQ1U782_9FLAO|nr:four helix bundle protein [Flavobacterium limi]